MWGDEILGGALTKVNLKAAEKSNTGCVLLIKNRCAERMARLTVKVSMDVKSGERELWIPTA
jgi:hypothetical protein